MVKRVSLQGGLMWQWFHGISHFPSPHPPSSRREMIDTAETPFLPAISSADGKNHTGHNLHVHMIRLN